MKHHFLAAAFVAMFPAFSIAADTAKAPAKPARSAVDPAKEAEHTKKDVRRHRIMAAAHEAAAKCQESGKDEELVHGRARQGVQGDRVRQVLWNEAPGLAPWPLPID